MLLPILVIWTAVLVFGFYWKNRKFFKMGNEIPGPTPLPIVGNAHIMIGKPSVMMKKIRKLSKQYGRLLRIWLGHFLNVLVFDPRDAEIVLKSRDTVKAYQYDYLKDWLGDSILLSSGEKFKRSKKLIMPSFHMNCLKEFIPIFHQHTKKMVNELQDEIDKDEFDIGNYISMCALRVLLETSLGVNKDSWSQEDLLKYSDAIQTLTKSALLRIIDIRLSLDIFFKYSNQKVKQDESLSIVNPIINEVIEHRKKEFQLKAEHKTETGEVVKEGFTFVDRFLLAKGEDGSKFTDKDIKDEVSTIMFGGHDTTTASAGFTLTMLACYQDCQDKVMQELDDIFGDSKRPATYEDLTQMTYLERCILETWRLYPPIPIIGKKATKDIALENYTLPAGTSIGIIIMMIHRNPEHFPDPDRFNPDHFLPERVKDRHPYAYIPFSNGTRTCVGRRYALLLLKIMISNILRHYRVFSKVSHHELRVVTHTVLRRKGGFKITIKPRNVDVTNARG